MRLAGQVVLLTGASRGIGRALAAWLAGQEARLALAARDAASLGAVARGLEARGVEVVTVAGDVGRDEDAACMARAALDAWGRIDVLVNNAAVLTPPAPVARTPAGSWEATLQANVVGTANLIRHVLPSMESQRRGLVVNMSSTWGRSVAPGVAPYCASKFAVEALTKALAMETAPGVVVFALNPGIVATDMLALAFGCEGVGDRGLAAYPRPEDLDERWARLFAEVAPAWHGTSRDL